MFDLGDGLIIGSNGIPWLIWIQLLVMLLLIILLYNLCTLSSGLGIDLPSSSSSTSTSLLASEVRSSPDRSFPTPASAITLSLPASKTVELGRNRGDAAAGTSSSRRKVVRNERNMDETDNGVATGKDSNPRLSDLSYHPCQFFGLARQAFLKCLGLDSNNNNSPSTSRRRQDKEE